MADQTGNSRAIYDLIRRVRNQEMRRQKLPPPPKPLGPPSVPMHWRSPIDVSPTYTVATWLTVDLAQAIPPTAVSVFISVSITTNSASAAAVKVRVDDAGAEYPLFTYDPSGFSGAFAGQFEVPINFRKFQIYVSASANAMTIQVLGHRRNPTELAPGLAGDSGSGGGGGLGTGSGGAGL